MADYLYSVAIQANSFQNNMADKAVWRIKPVADKREFTVHTHVRNSSTCAHMYLRTVYICVFISMCIACTYVRMYIHIMSLSTVNDVVFQLLCTACQKSVPMPTVNYRFLSRDRKWVWLAMKAFSFRNPYTKQVEYIICTNVVMK